MKALAPRLYNVELFPCSNQLSTKFILLINVKMSTIVGILTFISMINTHMKDLTQETSSFVGILNSLLMNFGKENFGKAPSLHMPGVGYFEPYEVASILPVT